MLSYESDKLFRFKVTVTLTYDPMISKSIGVIYWSPPASMLSLKVMGACNVEFRQNFAYKVSDV